MRIQPLIQKDSIDVAQWVPDSEFAIFPQGARAKEAFSAPDVVADPVLVSGKRYLFKRSKKSYPDQFWGEVIAYRVGCLLGVSVPPAFVAINSGSQISGALIEWFYIPPEMFVHGGDFMQMVRPDFDRDRGVKHNLEDIRVLMQALQPRFEAEFSWRQWWVDALLFDALIGNTDRHQDNWGLLATSIADKKFNLRMSPLFDNGTSLGHERFTDRVKNWSDETLASYVGKGKHHVKWKWSNEEAPINGHFALLQKAADNWQGTRARALARLEFDEDDMVNSIRDLVDIESPVPLTVDRLNFVIRLLRTRFNLLKEFLNAPATAYR